MIPYRELAAPTIVETKMLLAIRSAPGVVGFEGAAEPILIRKENNMKVWLRLLTGCAFALVFLAATAHADVVYTFSGVNTAVGGDGAPVAFTYTAPDFLFQVDTQTENVNGTCINCVLLLASQLDSCLNCLVSPIYSAVGFSPTAFDGFLGSQLVFNDANENSVFMFPLGAFAVAGTYSSTTPFNSGTLTVSVVGVPEPDSLALSLTGGVLLALVCLSRQKAADATQLAQTR